MRIFGIGIDVVEVDRIASAIERHGEPFLARLFTQAERDYCAAQKKPALHYAARFAAKEAVSKALGTGIGGEAGWLDLEIVRGPTGAPKLMLSGAAADFAKREGIREVSISLTHAKEYAAANAVAVADS
ncbi:holo-ACP synthase [Luteolibacter pohnpeiensis]|uniref:Holo-[acyl-carrier-protein] synthase n=1 Tax=Luteolibacter pohnpeiensis TaxID=454153 RepID=A0A934SBD0_9BACT|nr:holo-ACP synthase [Luteolibacter pohnpeiensis]MBK1882183.1 holo-ACP synthase [Luteolibacter pohnpeiensis]